MCHENLIMFHVVCRCQRLDLSGDLRELYCTLLHCTLCTYLCTVTVHVISTPGESLQQDIRPSGYETPPPPL
jgi:hypothetical protein